LQVNGGCAISKENGTAQIYGGAGGTVIAKYVADNWKVYGAGAQSISWAADPTITAATGGFPPPGFPNAVSVWLNVFNNTPNTGDYLFYSHVLEYHRFARLAWGTASAQPLSIGFWVAAQMTGNYSGSVRNAPANNRSYPFNFTINAASTWEWKTITIPGDTTGAWGGLLELCITIMSGATNKGVAGAWANIGYIGTNTTVNGAASNNRLSVTGLIMLPGIELPPAAQSALVVRPYDLEVLLCQRQYEKAEIMMQAPVAGPMIQTFTWKTSMRSVPTCTLTFLDGANATMVVNMAITDCGVAIQLNATAVGGYARYTLKGDARI
jgi:hypothetical protein